MHKHSGAVQFEKGLKCGFIILDYFRFFHRRICGSRFHEKEYGAQGRCAKKRWGEQRFTSACNLVDYRDDSLGDCEHGACCVVVFGYLTSFSDESEEITVFFAGWNLSRIKILS
jgi:hypothetical protein